MISKKLKKFKNMNLNKPQVIKEVKTEIRKYSEQVKIQHIKICEMQLRLYLK